VLKSLENLHVLVQCSLASSRKCAGAAVISEGFESLSARLRKVRTLAKDERERRIGVFGCPKRGKSTLLNVFLGGNVLPTGLAPKTHCAVELHNTAGTGAQSRVIVRCADGRIDSEHGLDFDGMREEMERHFCRYENVRTIQIYGNFSGGIALQNSVLIDTPGAEAAFENEAHEDGMQERGKELQEDTRRALEMLSEVDVPLFCMHAGNLGSNNEKKFFEQHMRRLRPVNVVNFKDEREDATESKLLDEVVKNYRVLGRDTVCISAKDGFKAIKAAGGYCAVQGDKWESSGIERLASAIRDRLKAMEPAEGLRRIATEYFFMLSEYASNSCDLLPPKAHWERMRGSLMVFPEAGEISEMLLSYGFLSRV